MRNSLQNIKHTLGILALLFVNSNDFTNEYEQKGCNDNRLLSYSIKNSQSMTSENIVSDIENSKYSRPDISTTKERNADKGIINISKNEPNFLRRFTGAYRLSS